MTGRIRPRRPCINHPYRAAYWVLGDGRRVCDACRPRSKDPIIGRLIRERYTLGLSQRAVAEFMGTTQSSVGEIESGHTRDPRIGTIRRYAAAVGLELILRYPPGAGGCSCVNPDPDPGDPEGRICMCGHRLDRHDPTGSCQSRSLEPPPEAGETAADASKTPETPEHEPTLRRLLDGRAYGTCPCNWRTIVASPQAVASWIWKHTREVQTAEQQRRATVRGGNGG